MPFSKFFPEAVEGDEKGLHCCIKQGLGRLQYVFEAAGEQLSGEDGIDCTPAPSEADWHVAIHSQHSRVLQLNPFDLPLLVSAFHQRPAHPQFCTIQGGNRQ